MAGPLNIRSPGASSCQPSALIGLAPYTDNIADALTARINAVTSAEGEYLAGCDPTFFPDDADAASKVQAWGTGLRSLGGWVRAVGEAFLTAATDGDLNTNPGHLPYISKTGATEIDPSAFPEDAIWIVNNSVLSKLSQSQRGGGFAVPTDVGQEINWSASSDPYRSLLQYAEDPGNDVDAGETIAKAAANLAGEGTDLAKDFGKGGAVLGGIGDVLDVAQIPGYIAADGFPAGLAHGAANLAGGWAIGSGADAFGDAVGEAIGGTIGDIGGPVVGFVAGAVFGALLGGITNAIFGPSATQQAYDDVSGAQPGSSTTFNQDTEQGVTKRLSSDPALEGTAKQTQSAQTQHRNDIGAGGRFGWSTYDTPTYSPWHPAPTG